MESYDMSLILSRVKFMNKMNLKQDAVDLVEREVNYIEFCCTEGRADIGYSFYRTFNNILSNKSKIKLENAINRYGNTETKDALHELLDENPLNMLK